MSDSSTVGSVFKSPSLASRIHLRRWYPSGDDRGLVILLHGLGDHVRRHEWAAGLLTGAGYRVVGFDWPGNGESDGIRGDMPSIAEAGRLLEEVIEEVGDQPIGMFAHSTGGFVLLNWLGSSPRASATLRWVWLNSPLLAPSHGQSSLRKYIARQLARRFPRLTLSTGVRMRDCFHSGFDPARELALKNDGGHHRVSLRFAMSLLDAEPQLAKAVSGLRENLAMIITQGSEDTICPPRYAEELFHRIPLAEKIFVLVSGARHEPFREHERQGISNAVRTWLERRASASKADQ